MSSRLPNRGPTLGKTLLAGLFLTAAASPLLLLLPDADKNAPQPTPKNRPPQTRTEPSPMVQPTRPADPLTCPEPAAARQQVLDAVIRKIEADDDLTGANWEPLARNAQAYLRERGYERPLPKLAIGDTNDTLARVAWDLQVMGSYRKDISKTFSPEMEDALKDFQMTSRLEPTGQPTVETLRMLGRRAYHQRVLIGLHTLRAQLRHGTPARELRVVIDAESSGNPYAAANTSTAQGLGQFTNLVMIEAVADFGHIIGYPELQKDAQAMLEKIRLKETLSPELQASRTLLLGLRNRIDIAVELIALHGKKIAGGTFDSKIVYPAYVFGPTGAQSLRSNAEKPAAEILPAAAKANPWLFYKGKVQRIDKITVLKLNPLPEPVKKTPPKPPAKPGAKQPAKPEVKPSVKPEMVKPPAKKVTASQAWPVTAWASLKNPPLPPRRPADLLPRAGLVVTIDKKRYRWENETIDRPAVDDNGAPIMIWANPFSAGEVLAQIVSRVAGANRVAEADRTETMLEALLRPALQPAPHCPPVSLPKAAP